MTSILLTSDSSQSGFLSPVTMIGLLVIYFAFFIFMQNRSRKKQGQKQLDMINALKKGDNVLVGGTIAGEIEQIKDGFVHVKIADKTVVRVTEKGVTPLAAEASEV